MPTRLHKNRKKRGDVSAGHGRIGKYFSILNDFLISFIKLLNTLHILSMNTIQFIFIFHLLFLISKENTENILAVEVMLEV